MKEEMLQALLLLAGFPVPTVVFPIQNGYDASRSTNSPWWLVQTPVGLVKIGWRKRVINIDWSNTPVRKVMTADDVTKEDHFVHAYSYGNAVIYLQRLQEEILQKQIELHREKDAPERASRCLSVVQRISEVWPRSCEVCGLGPCQVSAEAAERAVVAAKTTSPVEDKK